MQQTLIIIIWTSAFMACCKTTDIKITPTEYISKGASTKENTGPIKGQFSEVSTSVSSFYNDVPTRQRERLSAMLYDKAIALGKADDQTLTFDINISMINIDRKTPYKKVYGSSIFQENGSSKNIFLEEDGQKWFINAKSHQIDDYMKQYTYKFTLSRKPFGINKSPSLSRESDTIGEYEHANLNVTNPSFSNDIFANTDKKFLPRSSVVEVSKDNADIVSKMDLNEITVDFEIKAVAVLSDRRHKQRHGNSSSTSFHVFKRNNGEMINNSSPLKDGAREWHLENLSRKARDISSVVAPANTSAGPTDQPFTYDINHLAKQCPFSDICAQRNLTGSCCLPCSCESSCQLIGNCCDKHITKSVMCHSPYVQPVPESYEDDAFEYFIVDTCLNDALNESCRDKPAAPWGSFAPVYDSVTDMNFYNQHCAECSGARDYNKWDLILVCHALDVNDGLIHNVLLGIETGKCNIKFSPSKEIDIMRHVCSNKLISKCNTTGNWKMYDAELEKACSRWFSPVINMRGYLVYSNVYCAFCNGADYSPDRYCPSLLGRKTRFSSLTLTINYRKIEAVLQERFEKNVEPVEDGQCGKYKVKHISKPECYRVLCPNGSYRDKGKCKPITTKWMNDLYFVQLQLTPIGGDYIPFAYLKDLSDEQKKMPYTWFDSHGAPLQYFEIMMNKTAYVEKLVVRVGRSVFPLNMEKEVDVIKKAMSKSWTIRLQGDSFSFSVQFDDYAHFTRQQKRHDIIDYIKGVCIAYEEQMLEKYYMVVVNIPDSMSANAVVLKKTNFCERVRLVRSEWIGGFQQIRLNISAYNQQVLGDSAFDIYLDEFGQPTVEICVEDFNPNYRKVYVSSAGRWIFSGNKFMILFGLIWILC